MHKPACHMHMHMHAICTCACLPEEANVGTVEHKLERPLLVHPRAKVAELLAARLAPRKPRDVGT